MQEKTYPRLSSLSPASGCGCKIAPAVLEAMLADLPADNIYHDLRVGNIHRDDAAVFKISDREAVISTADFFTPIVDDPVVYGRIAAANAISDVYAMGGKPLMAIALLGWPTDLLPPEMAAQVMEGARNTCADAGIPIAGGHSIQAKEPFFGLSVTGIVNLNCIKENHTAKPGDLIYLTKPLGSGILAAAFKRGLTEPHEWDEAIQWMQKLNTSGSIFAQNPYVHAMTDVTGFGFLGHLKEMCGNLLSCEIQYNKIPIMPPALKFIEQFVFPDNTWRNWNAYADAVFLENEAHMPVLCDPQTNGGLLIAIDPEFAEAFQSLWEKELPGITCSPIGIFNAGESGKKNIIIRN